MTDKKDLKEKDERFKILVLEIEAERAAEKIERNADKKELKEKDDRFGILVLEFEIERDADKIERDADKKEIEVLRQQLIEKDARIQILEKVVQERPL